MSNYRQPYVSDTDDVDAAPPKTDEATHQCLFCHHAPFKVEGRWVRHMEKKHADEWSAYMLGRPSPSVIFPEPVGRPGFSGLGMGCSDDEDGDEYEILSNFTRILHLLRPLTDLETRIKTTLDLRPEDYDSDEATELPQQDESMADPLAEPETPQRSHIEDYPDTPTIIGTDMSAHTPDEESLFYPFRSGHEFKLAKWIMDGNLPKHAIDQYFNKGLARAPPRNNDGTEGSCFTSAYTLGKLLDNLDKDLGMKSWKRAAVDHYGTGAIEFRYRSLEAMIRHIFKQPSHAEYMMYMPYKEFDPVSGYRMYSEMASARWWWHKQEHLPEGHFVIPVILGSDETFQTNFSGDKNIWPLNITVANIPAHHRNKPTQSAWRTLALLPIRPKRADKTKAHTDEEKTSALEYVQSVLELVLQDLKRLWEEGIELTCPDGKVRIGHPVLGGWLADYPEYIKLFSASYMSCPVCIAPRGQLDAHSAEPITHRNISADEIRDRVKAKDVAITTRAGYKKTTQEHADLTAKLNDLNGFFTLNRVAPVDNLLFRLPHASPRSLWRPDLLHTIDLGMTKHCLELMFNMLDELSSKKQKDFRPLTDLFDITWTAVSPHPAISVPKKKYRSVKQWSGKEYRNAMAIVLGVLEAVMMTYPPSSEEHERIYEGSLNFVSALSNFILMARQKSHTLPADTIFDNEYRAQWDGKKEPDPHASISFLQTYLADFHEWKYIFLKYRASKRVKLDARKYAKGLHPDIPDPSPAQKTKLSADRKLAKTEYLERHSNYNMPKVHMMVHFAETIDQYGSLPQWSTSIIELLHQPLNNAYDRSNKVDAMDQTLRFAGWKDAMAILVANLISLCRGNTISEELKSEIKLWLDIFDNKKAKLTAARLNRNRMLPKNNTTIRKQQKQAQQDEHFAMIRDLAEEWNISEQEDEDSDNSADDEEDAISDLVRDLTAAPPSRRERDAKERQKDPGRLLRGRMLSITNDEGQKRSFMTVGDIETYLRINGLARALTDCLRKEGIHGTISTHKVPELEAAPFLALRIRRTAFQTDELENHIIRCTSGENFRNSLPRADFVVYNPAEAIDNPVMGHRTIGQLRCLFRVRFPDESGMRSSYARFAAIRPMVQLPFKSAAHRKRSMPVFEFTEKDITIIRIGAIERAACVIPIPSRKFGVPNSPRHLWENATRVVLNTKVDLDSYHSYY